jgi:Flp pilus assembly protein TadG
MIEFAFMLTGLMLIFTAIVGYGAMFWTQQQLAAAAGEGARAGLKASYAGRPDVQAVACAAAKSILGADTSVQCNGTATPFACAWAGAGGATVGCIEVSLSYDVAQWPLLQSFKNLLKFAAGASAESLIPSRLTARATLQITQEPL